MSEMKIAFLGDVAVQLTAAALREALAAKGIAVEVCEAPFDQVRRQLLTAESEVHAFAPQVVVVWEAAERWPERPASVEDRLGNVESYCRAVPGTVLYVNAVVSPGVDAREVRRFNVGLDDLAARVGNLKIVDLAALVAQAGRTAWCDPVLYYTASMALLPDGQRALAGRIADKIAAACGRERKCVVVDLDGTLWGGVVGEDGVSGIDIGGESPLGRTYADFQRWLKGLKDRGILLAVCSKNDEALAREAFAVRAEMPLKETDFVAFAANWDPKPDNAAAMAAQLNLGLDAFVFLDDRKVEREAMRAAHPEVTVPELPEDPAEWIGFLEGLNLFETASASADDAERTARYRAEAERNVRRATFANEADFLRDLQMEAEEVPLDEGTIPRVARLMQRTNQFNLTTKRYSEGDLMRFRNDSSSVPLVLRLADRFGDLGIVSFILGVQTGDELVIDSWLMSCRAIGRGLEKLAFNRLVAKAKALGLKTLVGRYLPTARNGLVKNLYPQLGFQARADGAWTIDVDVCRELKGEIGLMFDV